MFHGHHCLRLKRAVSASTIETCERVATVPFTQGVGFFSGAVAYNAGGNCPQLDVSDATAEWISFDCCSGHSTGDGAYHYHFPPSCLIAQAEADAPLDGGHSPQIGWAQDGFPI